MELEFKGQKLFNVKTMKKALCLFMSVLMLVSSFGGSLSVFAEGGTVPESVVIDTEETTAPEEPVTEAEEESTTEVEEEAKVPLWDSVYSEGDFEYSIADGEATITGYNGDGGDVVIPDTLGGYPVTVIGGCAFFLKDSITSVEIPDSVKDISYEAFEYCKNLERVVIGNNVATIGSCAFYFCTSLKSIILPDSVSFIDGEAFFGCENLENIIISDSVTSINNTAFAGCTSLTNAHYSGTQDQWDEVYVGFGNNYLTDVIHMATDEDEDGICDLCVGLSEEETTEEFTTVPPTWDDPSWDYEDETTTRHPTTRPTTTMMPTTTMPAEPPSWVEPSWDYDETTDDWYDPSYDYDETTRDYTESVYSITVGETKSVNLYGNDIIYFAFVPEETAVYTFRSHNNNGDPYGVLCDANFDELDYNDDGAGNMNFYITYELQAGQTYYLGAKCYAMGSGSYSVTLDYGEYVPETTDDWYDPSYDYDETTDEWYDPSYDYEDTTDGYYESVSIVEGETSRIDSYPDNGEKVFVFVPEESGEYRFYSDSDCDPRCNLYDRHMNYLCYYDDNNGYEFDFTYYLTAGETYYLYVGFYSFNSFCDITVEKVCPHENTTYYAEVSPTCTESGFSEGTFCDDCEKWIEGHRYLRPRHTDADSNGICDVCEDNAPVTSGDVSRGNISWDLYADGELVINGTGSVPNGFMSYKLRDDVKTITVNEGITGLEWSAFNNFYNVTSVSLPEGLTRIENDAFCDCYDLKTINIPDTVTFIGSYAFGSSGITSISVPAATDYIADNAFYYCESLQEINVHEDNENYASEDGVIFNSDKTTLICYPAGKTDTEYTVPDSVVYIGYGSFRRAENLTSVIIPDNVEEIGAYAFEQCYVLKNVTIPDSVTRIDYGVFSYCYALENIVIPDSVTSIGSYAFNGCEGLESIEIPDSVTGIENNAFSNCYALENIVIPDSVTSIGSYAFNGCEGLESIEIPDSVTSIEYNAFSYCYALENIVIPDSVTYLGSSAFSGCHDLKIVEIGSGISNIEYYTFGGCYELEKVVLPDSISTIGERAFYYCTALKSIEIPDSVTKIKRNAFAYSGLKDIYIPGSVTTIGNRAFSNCKSLENAVIAEGVQKIGKNVFLKCKKLETVTIPASVTIIDDSAFKKCDKLSTVYYQGTQEQWEEISVGINNYCLTDAEIIFSACAHENTVREAALYPESCAQPGYTAGIYCEDCQQWISGHKEDALPHYDADFNGICDICVGDSPETKITDGDVEPITLGETKKSNKKVMNYTYVPERSWEYELDFDSNSYAEIYVLNSKLKRVNYNDGYSFGFGMYLEEGEPYCFKVVYEGRNSYRLSFTNSCFHDNTTEHDEIEATCSEPGYTEGIYCEDCHEWIEGHYETTVPHTDKNGDSLCDSCGFNDWVIYLDETKTICVDEGEITYLAFTPEESGTYTFWSDDWGDDTYGYICDSEKNELASDDDYLHYGNFAVSYYLEAGETYYLGARYWEDYDGYFDVTISFGDREDLFDDWDDDDDWWGEVWENGYTAEVINDGEDCQIIEMYEATHKAYANGGDLVVPETIDGYPVAGFSSYGLEDGDNVLRSITFPASVYSIPYSAFVDNGFANLEEIIVDENNETYKSIDGVLYNYDVTEILAVPRAYKGVLRIPATVENIEEGIFAGVNGITEIVFEGNTETVLEGNVLYNADKTRIIKAFDLKGTYEMPETVTAIDSYAFADLDELEEVKFSPNVTQIVYYTFFDCDALETVETPDSLVSVGQSAFEGCDSLTEFEFKEGFEELEYRAFYESGLESVALPSTFNGNAGEAFAQCENLREVDLGTGAAYVDGAMFYGCTELKEIDIPSNVTEINDYAFAETGLENLVIPDSVKFLDSAFCDCDNLRTVVIGDGAVDISHAFRGCDALESVTLGKSIKYMHSAFYGCRSLREVEIPEGFDGFDEYAFSDCKALSDVELPSTVQTIAYGQFRDCSSLEEFELPENLQSIDAHAFDDTAWYDSQEDGDTYFDTALYAYKGTMPENYQLVVKDGTTLIADSAYEDEYNLTLIDIPDGVRYIGDDAFYNTGVETVILPDSLERIGWGAFEDCYDLSDVYYTGTQTQWEEIEIDKYNDDLLFANIHFEYSRCAHENKVNTEATSASCGTPGFTAGVLCTDCNEYISGHKAIGLQHQDVDFNGECDICFATATELTLNEYTDVYVGKGETKYLKFVPEKSVNYYFDSWYKYGCEVSLYNDRYELITTCDANGEEAFALTEGETYYLGLRLGFSAVKGTAEVIIKNSVYRYTDDYDYMITDNSVEIRHYNGRDTEVTVPAEFEGLEVNTIGVASFCENYRMETITIPENVTTISYHVFDSCYSLREVYLPSTLESIDESSFDSTENLCDVYYNGTTEEFGNLYIDYDNGYLLNANIHCLDGEFLAYFTEGDFEYRVDFRDGFEGSVAVAAYNGDGGDVVIPETVRGYTVTSIGEYVFDERADITSITIPSGIKLIEYGAFRFCPNIKKVYITDIVQWCSIQFIYETGNPLNADADLYLNGELVTNLVIPEGVEEISTYAFMGCTSIETVEIPLSLNRVSWCAFGYGYVENITDVYYPGTEHQWNEIEIEYGNDCFVNANIHFGSEAHEHSNVSETVEPTCTEEGYTLHRCVECGYSTRDSFVPALGHTDADADEICDVCGESIGEPVPDHMAGDINDDGTVNNKDLNRLMKYLAGDSVTVNEAAIDVNGDGKVNNKDLNRLMKYLAGDKVELH